MLQPFEWNGDWFDDAGNVKAWWFSWWLTFYRNRFAHRYDPKPDGFEKLSPQDQEAWYAGQAFDECVRQMADSDADAQVAWIKPTPPPRFDGESDEEYEKRAKRLNDLRKAAYDYDLRGIAPDPSLDPFPNRVKPA